MKNEAGKINKIIVPVDFSECSRNALETAGLLARKLNASLLVLHAYNVPTPAHQMKVSLFQYNIDDLHAEENDKLITFIRNTEGLADIPTERKALPIFAHEDVSSKIESENCDLIIMGTIGASGIKDVFMGSITQNVIKKSKVPVLSVPPNTKINEGINRLAFGIDCNTAQNIGCFNPLIALADVFDADTHIVHIGEKRCLDLEEVILARNLNSKLSSIHPSFHFEINSNINDGLAHYIRKYDIDILALLPCHQKVLDKFIQPKDNGADIENKEVPLLTLT